MQNNLNRSRETKVYANKKKERKKNTNKQECTTTSNNNKKKKFQKNLIEQRKIRNTVTWNN